MWTSRRQATGQQQSLCQNQQQICSKKNSPKNALFAYGMLFQHKNTLCNICRHQSKTLSLRMSKENTNEAMALKLFAKNTIVIIMLAERVTRCHFIFHIIHITRQNNSNKMRSWNLNKNREKKKKKSTSWQSVAMKTVHVFFCLHKGINKCCFLHSFWVWLCYWISLYSGVLINSQFVQLY